MELRHPIAKDSVASRSAAGKDSVASHGADGKHSVASHAADATRQLGRALGRELRGGEVLAVSGDLGAGKTCLVQGIAQGLDVDPAVPIQSPTFTLVGEYAGRLPLVHADFYRVESYARLAGAGFEDLLDGEGVVVVEWAERFPEVLPEDRLEIHIEIEPDGGEGEPPRRLALRGRGPRSVELERALRKIWR